MRLPIPANNASHNCKSAQSMVLIDHIPVSRPRKPGHHEPPIPPPNQTKLEGQAYEASNLTGPCCNIARRAILWLLTTGSCTAGADLAA